MTQSLRKIFKEIGSDYPQTWYFVSGRGSRIAGFVEWACNLITKGHELSETEWGYSGGEFADCYCRWCNKKIRVSKSVIQFKFKDSAWLMDDVGKEGIAVTKNED